LRFPTTIPTRDDHPFLNPNFVLTLAVAVALWVPLAHVDWLIAREGHSYVWRTVEWATELRAGQLYPRWCPDFYGGYGSPLFLFYAPVVYGLAGVLTATFLDPFSALKVVALGFSLITAIGTYALVFGETRQRDAALLGAVAYLAAPYRIANLYERGDLGEFACIAVLPAAIALYRAAAAEARPQRARWLAAAAALVHAATIMTHAILGFWGTVLIGLVVAATSVQLFRRGLGRRVLLLGGALVLAQGLAAVYTIPAIVYKTATHTAGMVVGYYHASDNWIILGTLFEKDRYQIGPLLVTSLVVAAIGLLVNRRVGRRALGWAALTVLLVVATLKQASWFWEPGGIPTVEFIQFPWRLLGPAALTASVALGAGMAAVLERLPGAIRGGIAIAGATAMLLVFAWPHAVTDAAYVLGIPSDSDSIRQGMQSATDADEYLPHAVAFPPAAPRRELVAAAEGAVVDVVHSDGSHHDVAARAERDEAVLRLALYGFPGWKVETLSGPAKATLDADEHGLLRVHLPVAGAYRLRLRFGAAPGLRIGTFLSVMSLLALGLFLLRGSRLWRWRFPAWPSDV
jgi:hypothetical protein